METSNFINHLAAGNASEAKSALTDMLSAKAFEALDAKKQEIGSTLFGGQEEVASQEVETEQPTE